MVSQDWDNVWDTKTARELWRKSPSEKLLYCIYYEDVEVYKVGKTIHLGKRYDQHRRQLDLVLDNPPLLVGVASSLAWANNPIVSGTRGGEANMLKQCRGLLGEPVKGREFFKKPTSEKGENLFRSLWYNFGSCGGLAKLFADSWMDYEMRILSHLGRNAYRNPRNLELAQKYEEAKKEHHYIEFLRNVFSLDPPSYELRKRMGVAHHAFPLLRTYYRRKEEADTNGWEP